jgi:hypothetical protein
METLNNIKKINYAKIIMIAIIVIVIVIVILYGVSLWNKTNKQPIGQQTPVNADLPREFKEMYGLNVNSSDTDGDGVTDKDEINLYQTNPLSADSKPETK